MNRSPFVALLTLALLAIGASALHAGTSNRKKEVLSVRIHGEGGAEEGEKFTVPVVLLDGRRAPLSIMPLLTEHDIKSVYPFRVSDGSFGVYLRLDPHGANLLTQYSLERTGRNNVLAVMVNGRQVTDVLVDKPVRDGLFCIPQGLTMVEAARFVNAYPVTGQENAKSQKKKTPKFMPSNIMLPPKSSDLSGASAPTPAAP
jgi:hypothetical protein